METIGNETAILFQMCSICFHSADCLFPFRRLKSLILSSPDFQIRWHLVMISFTLFSGAVGSVVWRVHEGVGRPGEHAAGLLELSTAGNLFQSLAYSERPCYCVTR